MFNFFTNPFDGITKYLLVSSCAFVELFLVEFLLDLMLLFIVCSG